MCRKQATAELPQCTVKTLSMIIRAWKFTLDFSPNIKIQFFLQLWRSFPRWKSVIIYSYNSTTVFLIFNQNFSLLSPSQKPLVSLRIALFPGFLSGINNFQQGTPIKLKCEQASHDWIQKLQILWNKPGADKKGRNL